MVAKIANLLAIFTVVALASEAFAQPPEGGAIGRPQGGPPWMRARIMFQLFDTDRDGALTADETPEMAWGYLSAADTNEDGKVTQAEVATLWATRIVANFDENGDGELTASETPAPIWDRLKAAAADDNGSISAAEIVETILAAPRRGGPPADGRQQGGRPGNSE